MATNTPKHLQLYSYWSSSCSQRVRIVLGLKGIDYDYKPVNLMKNEQYDPEFEKINPIKCVPALVDGDVVIADSLAIIMYLEDKYPEVPMLPRDDARKKALNLQVAGIVGSSIQPLANDLVASIVGSRVQPLLNSPFPEFIQEKFNSDEALLWGRHHICKGFTAIEKLLQGHAGRYATGDEIQLADVFLAPQIRGGIVGFKVDMSRFPTLLRLHEAYTEHPVLKASEPATQPDGCWPNPDQPLISGWSFKIQGSLMLLLD